MPITKAGLSAAIVTAQNGASPTANAETGESGVSIRKTNADALADAIVTYLLANAVVVGTCPPGTAGGPLIAGKIT